MNCFWNGEEPTHQLYSETSGNTDRKSRKVEVGKKLIVKYNNLGCVSFVSIVDSTYKCDEQSEEVDIMPPSKTGKGVKKYFAAPEEPLIGKEALPIVGKRKKKFVPEGNELEIRKRYREGGDVGEFTVKELSAFLDLQGLCRNYVSHFCCGVRTPPRES